MNPSRSLTLLLVVMLLGGGFAYWREHTAAQRLQTELVAATAQLSELEKLRADLDRLAAENQRLRAEAVEPSELARLRALGNDVRRLQGEKLELEKKLAAAEAARRRAEADAAALPSEPEPAVPGELAKGRVVVASGETILSGGWTKADGRHGFAFITPTEVVQPNGHRLVQVEARLASVSRDAFRATGLDSFGPSAGAISGSFSGIVPSKQAGDVLRILNADGATEVLGAPIMLTGEGVQGELSFPSKDGQVTRLNFDHLKGADGRSLEISFTIRDGSVP